MRRARGTDDVSAVYVDMGTTNTRAWVMIGDRVCAHASQSTGVRDTARAGSAEQVRSALRDLIAEVRTQATQNYAPKYVAATGMISSPLGLMDVPHVPAPAGLAEIAAGSQWSEFPEVTELPILLVPGVRSGPNNAPVESIGSSDVMRGEETLCMGLHALSLVSLPGLVLNLGSHWKAIRLNREGQIQAGTTSLSGELIHAAQTHTILAGSVLNDRPRTIPNDWMVNGMEEQRRSGLSRALFCVRLLQLAGKGTSEERLGFLIGAFIAADLDALTSQGVLNAATPVFIVGAEALAEAWRSALSAAGIRATVISAAESERALLTGLQRILLASCRRRQLAGPM